MKPEQGLDPEVAHYAVLVNARTPPGLRDDNCDNLRIRRNWGLRHVVSMHRMLVRFDRESHRTRKWQDWIFRIVRLLFRLWATLTMVLLCVTYAVITPPNSIFQAKRHYWMLYAAQV